jgi:group I intron endonuclease
MSWSVYKHTCPDGKVYIGATSKLPRVRWNYGYGYRGTLFFTAITKYGWNNIQHEVLATDLTAEQAHELEVLLIAQHDSTNPERGYNRASGGRGTPGVVISEETRQKLVTSHLGKKNPHTPEWNEKIREGNLGRKKPHVGIPRSEESKAKIAAAHSKRVGQYDLNLNLIRVFDSLRSAAKETNIKNQNISACCLGRTKTAGGYIWKYQENMEEKQHG